MTPENALSLGYFELTARRHVYDPPVRNFEDGVPRSAPGKRGLDIHMDKAEFIDKAPAYYALAIAVVLRRANAPRSEFSIKQAYPEEPDAIGEIGSLLGRWPLWERAVAWLLARDMISVKADPFGPPIFSASSSFESQWDELCQTESLPFSSYLAAQLNIEWLMSALHSVDNHYENLEMKVADFESPDAEWAPIKIDVSEPEVAKAIASLEHIIEEVRSDNGYSATQPEERDFVLDGLDKTLTRFKSDAISAGYIKSAFEKLQILSRRFAGSVKEAAIVGAKTALVEFAKKHFGDALNYVWKFFF